MKQTSFFDAEIPVWQGGAEALARTSDPRTLARREGPGASQAGARHIVESGGAESQCALILTLLRLRPVTSKELAAVSLKYTSRISELKQAGHHIECRPTKDFETGKRAFVYILIEGDA